jgi:hypothetical protein
MAIGKRANFDLIYSKYKAMGKGNVRLTQSSLFLTKDIDPTKSTYDFDVLENQTQTLQPDEIRLNINDEHIIQSLGVYLYGTYTNKEGTVELGKQLFTYVPYELGYGADAEDKPVRLKNLYAGTLKIAVNNIVYLEKWDTRRSEKITRTQFSNHNPGVFDSTTPSNDFSMDGMVKFEPLIVLSGAKKNDITIRLPQAIVGGTFIFVNDEDKEVNVTINKIAVRTFGLLAQNAAAFQ